MSRFTGRTVVVTGGAQGIGAVLATSLAADGAFVAVADVLPTDSTVEAIHRAGGEALGGVCDVTDTDSVNRFIGEVLARQRTVDGLITNAAMFTSLRPQRFEDIPSAEFDRVLSVNVRGTFEMVRAVAPVMRREGAGSIVTIGSGTIYKGIPLWAHYVASKGAIVALTRSLARELGDDGIRVNCVAPGLTASDGVLNHAESFPQVFTERQIASRCLPREQTPQDLVGVMKFLLSDESAFMSGQTLVVDGGSAFI
ncbi:SDR family oxidoreductase [Streptomyces sp. SID8361]|uniref:SDR family NAD(P)-dependent oxidoreductase n=1 Tax=Streptomyces sp. MnatMP-M27 TaxID=1839768 RepID=UPI00081EA1F3|nr:SDR family oxidoreductase [Streptomyces sp. MnatMP-M27]MYU16175.1 SDR family oxidoreductase [Streptomyces sp. SID8361]SCG10736.1 NAD(P)-dependent dehydrogenase, short-chain alcohol dehydrogenase family [Streptomyces sp. MnatMP-M27]